ncbi:MAG: hypothetical protein RLO50_06075 [Azospirillaceae bacterium]
MTTDPSHGSFPFPPDARVWQRLLSGRRINLLDPSPLDFELEDIAFALSRVARWGGQTVGDHLYSVAQHSLMVLEIGETLSRKPLTTAEKKAFLVHDAEEGFISFDPISPLKPWLGAAYREIASRTKAAVHLRVGLPATIPEPLKRRIKRADRIAAATEAVSVAGYRHAEVRPVLKIPADPLPERVAAWSSKEACDRYLTRLRALMGR